jgi:hypothetical protein
MKGNRPLSEYDLREVEREYLIYQRLHRHLPGRKCNPETFMLASARKKLKKNLTNRAGISNHDLMGCLEKQLRRRRLKFAPACYPDPSSDLTKANKFARTKSAKAVVQWKEREFTRWVGGPFRKAVSMVLAGLEGKPAPTRRELLRYFRAPGNKNCSAEELAGFQGMIDRMAAEIATWRPNPNDPNLDPAVNELIPRDGQGSPQNRDVRATEWNGEFQSNIKGGGNG